MIVDQIWRIKLIFCCDSSVNIISDLDEKKVEIKSPDSCGVTDIDIKLITNLVQKFAPICFETVHTISVSSLNLIKFQIKPI